MHLQGQVHDEYARAAKRRAREPRTWPATMSTMMAMDTHSPYRDIVWATSTACCPRAQPNPASIPAQPSEPMMSSTRKVTQLMAVHPATA